jgi:hypothetical protein
MYLDGAEQVTYEAAQGTRIRRCADIAVDARVVVSSMLESSGSTGLPMDLFEPGIIDPTKFALRWRMRSVASLCCPRRA